MPLNADAVFHSRKQALFLLNEHSSFSQPVYFTKLQNPKLIQC